MASAAVIAIALVGLALVAAWSRREESQGARLAALVGCALGLVAAFVAALVAGKTGIESVAIALAGGAVLPLVLLVQMRLVRALVARR
jgi:hypothetical protein